jgi:hypothetical protein
MQIGLYHHRLRGARRVVSEGIARAIFPADCPHRMDFHAIARDRVPPDARIFQHIARFVYGTTNPLDR